MELDQPGAPQARHAALSRTAEPSTINARGHLETRGLAAKIKAAFLRKNSLRIKAAPSFAAATGLLHGYSTTATLPTEQVAPRSTLASSPMGSLVAGERRVNVQATVVAVEMENMLGHQATWTPSGPYSGNTFEQWVSAAKQTSEPSLDQRETTINCWEMVLLAAFRSNAVGWDWLHDLYRTDNLGRADWYMEAVHRMAPGGTRAFNANDPEGPEPQRGDLVFWNGMSHVGLALGTRDSAGRHEVYSFWPPPDGSYQDPYDPVKVTTIEELADYMRANYMGDPRVEFGEPAW